MKKKILILDSSVIVKWLNSQNETFLEQADKILKQVEKGKAEIIVPELVKYEIGNAILNKKLTLPETKSCLATLYAIPISFIPLDLETAQRTMEIASQLNITYYDASFLSLAEKWEAVLITDNPKHQKKSIRGKVKVIAIKDYKQSKT